MEREIWLLFDSPDLDDFLLSSLPPVGVVVPSLPSGWSSPPSRRGGRPLPPVRGGYKNGGGLARADFLMANSRGHLAKADSLNFKKNASWSSCRPPDNNYNTN